MADPCEKGDEPSGYSATELFMYRQWSEAAIQEAKTVSSREMWPCTLLLLHFVYHTERCRVYCRAWKAVWRPHPGETLLVLGGGELFV
jgi:hypothetical protein